MLWINIRIFCLFLTVLSVGANHLEEDVSSEPLTTVPNTELPIALQLSTTVNPDKLEPLTGLIKKLSEDNHVIRKHIDNNLDVNDIEVFNDRLGPQMEKQEEEEAVVEAAAEPDEEVAEEESKPEEEEEPKEEEPESQPPAGGEAEPEEPKEEEEETAVEADEPEPVKEEETPAETPTEEKHETVPEAEEETPIEETAPDAGTEIQTAVEEEAAADNADIDMPNDEPAKNEDNNVTEKPTDVTETAVTTDDKDKNKISCFTCTSKDDLKCHKSPTQQTPCPKANGSEKEKENGCYTLYETDTNITMRGCVDELAEEGLKYCLTNEKFCHLCYKTGCNNKTAPNSGNVQQLNIFALFTAMMTLMAIRK